MGIKNTQRRVTIIMNKSDYELVEQAARKDRRSVSSYCNNIIMCNIENNDSIYVSIPIEQEVDGKIEYSTARTIFRISPVDISYLYKYFVFS